MTGEVPALNLAPIPANGKSETAEQHQPGHGFQQFVQILQVTNRQSYHLLKIIKSHRLVLQHFVFTICQAQQLLQDYLGSRRVGQASLVSTNIDMGNACFSHYP